MFTLPLPAGYTYVCFDAGMNPFVRAGLSAGSNSSRRICFDAVTFAAPVALEASLDIYLAQVAPNPPLVAYTGDLKHSVGN